MILSKWLVLAPAAVLLAAGHAGAQEDTSADKFQGKQIFYRVVGAQTNAPIMPKTRSAIAEDWGDGTGGTGMADSGFTEYPWMSGVMDLTFVEGYAHYPRFISGAQADTTRVNTADMVIDHVYQPDGVVWGLSGRRMAQTFTATTDELVSMTLMMASEPGVFRAVLLAGGPKGQQVGSVKTFWSGGSMDWGYVRWRAGEAPLTPGGTYAIRIWREDGKAFSPYLHSTGNAYDGGMLYVDGLPRSESDLAAWILEQPEDMKRSVIEGADDSGWVYNTDRVWFTARTRNVRMISVSSSPHDEQCLNVVVRVRDSQGKVVAGPKFNLACGVPAGQRTGHVIFGANEFPTEPGQRYEVQVDYAAFAEGEKPDPSGWNVVAKDLRVYVYGEPLPGVYPSIYNLTAKLNSDSEVEFSWSQPFPAPVKIQVSGHGPQGGKTFDVHKNQNSIKIPLLWSGHDYLFDISTEGPTGMVWKTPRYHIRMPRNDVEPVVQPEYPAQFITIAAPTLSAAPEYGAIRYVAEVEVPNGGFEDGIKGWTTQGEDEIYVTGPEHDMSPYYGDGMAGWSLAAGAQREQVFRSGALHRKIKTTPGNRYVMSVWARTAAGGGTRGDTRVRLFADPKGGTDFEGRNTSQWYWTDGRWMRFQHSWTADGNQSTVGAGFFRWRDLDLASAYVDNVVVFDLGPAATPAAAGSIPERDRLPALIIDGVRVEADEKVEAYAEAPAGYVITGMGTRGHEDNVTTVWLKVQPLLADGSMGDPEYIRGGWSPDSNLEAKIELPEGYVATGFGARAAPEWDVKSLHLWARPLSRSGRLGEERMFSGGIEPDRGPERQINLEPGRILKAAGLNMGFNDIDRIAGSSAVLRPSASGLGR